jgi:hypothetical protein
MVYGTKWVLIGVTNDYEDERVTLATANVPHHIQGGEATVALDRIHQLKALAPDMQGAVWDKLLRGMHVDDLYEIAVQVVAKVALAPGGKPKTRRLGRYTVRRGKISLGNVDVYAIAGHPGVRFPVHGELEWVPLTKRHVRATPDNRRWYGEYELPKDPRVPPALRGGRVRLRLNGRAKIDNSDMNLAEILRTVTEQNQSEWSLLHHDRPGSESDNARLKSRLPKGRAPSLGIQRQRVDLLCRQLFHNIRALIAHERRTALPTAA